MFLEAELRMPMKVLAQFGQTAVLVVEEGGVDRLGHEIPDAC